MARSMRTEANFNDHRHDCRLIGIIVISGTSADKGWSCDTAGGKGEEWQSFEAESGSQGLRIFLA